MKDIFSIKDILMENILEKIFDNFNIQLNLILINFENISLNIDKLNSCSISEYSLNIKEKIMNLFIGINTLKDIVNNNNILNNFNILDTFSIIYNLFDDKLTFNYININIDIKKYVYLYGNEKDFLLVIYFLLNDILLNDIQKNIFIKTNDLNKKIIIEFLFESNNIYNFYINFHNKKEYMIIDELLKNSVNGVFKIDIIENKIKYIIEIKKVGCKLWK